MKFNKAGADMTWNDERVETLKKLWSEGLSASQIANRLGRDLSRNAVIGKVHRLGLSGRASQRHSMVMRRVGKVSAAMQHSKLATASKRRALIRRGKYDEARAACVVVAPTFKPLPLPPEPVRPAKLVSFAELEDHHCRFIFGDPKTADHGFCGAKKAPGLSYCDGHAHGENGCLVGVPAPKNRVRTYIPHKSNGYRILANSVRSFE
jgi:GcrA cell cycle regulator